MLLHLTHRRLRGERRSDCLFAPRPPRAEVADALLVPSSPAAVARGRPKFVFREHRNVPNPEFCMEQQEHECPDSGAAGRWTIRVFPQRIVNLRELRGSIQDSSWHRL